MSDPRFVTYENVDPASVLPERFKPMELLEILAGQWGPQLPFSLSLDTTSNTFMTKNHMVEMTCGNMECRNRHNVLVKALVTFRSRGYSCDKCRFPMVQPDLSRIANGPSDRMIAESLRLNPGWIDKNAPEINQDEVESSTSTDVETDPKTKESFVVDKETGEQIPVFKAESAPMESYLDEETRKRIEQEIATMEQRRNATEKATQQPEVIVPEQPKIEEPEEEVEEDPSLNVTADKRMTPLMKETMRQETKPLNITIVEDEPEDVISHPTNPESQVITIVRQMPVEVEDINIEIVAERKEEVATESAESDVLDPPLSLQERLNMALVNFNNRFYYRAAGLFSTFGYIPWLLAVGNGYEPLIQSYEFNEKENMLENITLECSICHNQMVWPSEEEFFDSEIGFDSVHQVMDIPLPFHSCDPCQTSIENSRNPVQNMNLRAKLKEYLIKYSLTLESVGKSPEEKLISPSVILHLRGENGKTISLSLDQLEEQVKEGRITTSTFHKVKDKEQKPKETEALIERETVDEQRSKIDATMVKALFEPDTVNANSRIYTEESKRFGEEEHLIPPPSSGGLLFREDISTEKNDSLLMQEEIRKREIARQEASNIVRAKVEKMRQVMAGTIKPFDTKDSSFREFRDSPMGKTINLATEIATTYMSGIKKQVIIEETAMNVPIIDYNTGVRVICIDYELRSKLIHFNPVIIDERIPFTFLHNDRKIQSGELKARDAVKEYSTFFLYSDTAAYRGAQAAGALAKIIVGNLSGPSNFVQDKVVDLKDYPLFYATERTAINDFDNCYGTTPMGKPSTGRVMIIAVVDKERIMTPFEKQNFNMNTEQEFLSRGLYTVASGKYLEYPPDKNSLMSPVVYRITDYIEAFEVWLTDGIEAVMSAIAKEHFVKYGARPYQFVFEVDKSSFTSPSVKWYSQNVCRDGLVISQRQQYLANGQFNPDYNKDWVFIKEKSPEFRRNEQDYYRQDSRFFNAYGLLSRFRDLINAEGIDIRDKRQTDHFLKSQGYIKMDMPAYLTFTPSYEMMTRVEWRRNDVAFIIPSSFYTKGVAASGANQDPDLYHSIMSVRAKNIENSIYIHEHGASEEDLERIEKERRELEYLEKEAIRKEEEQLKRAQQKQFGFGFIVGQNQPQPPGPMPGSYETWVAPPKGSIKEH